MIDLLCKVIEEKLTANARVCIAIDGMAAAGKTTLAERLAQKFGGEVVHMDDFFLPFELRSAERIGEAGGNVHYERFSSEVAAGLTGGKPFEYGVFSCTEMAIAGTKHIENSGLVIVEGAYCLRPEFRELYDFKVFMKVDPETQEERILARSNPQKLKDFKTRWIPLETAYFEGLNPEAAADLVIIADSL